MPLNRRCVFVAGVKTVFNSPLGDPKKIIKIMKEKGIDVALSDTPCAYNTFLNVKVRGVSYSDIPMILRISYLAFEFLPKKFIFEEPMDMYSLYFGQPCEPFLSDIPVIASFLSYDFPSYSFILGDRRNILQNISCQDVTPLNLRGTVPISDGINISAYLYSERGYSFPGEEARGGGRYILKVGKRKVILLLSKNEKLIGVYDQNYINEPVSEKGSYSAKIYSYSFKIGTVYFGLRFLSCIPPIYIK